MKKLLLIFIAISLIGCEEKIINRDDIVITDGIAHFKHDMTLVTGKARGWFRSRLTVLLILTPDKSGCQNARPTLAVRPSQSFTNPLPSIANQRKKFGI
jgi:hypothetical protein